MTVHPRAPQTRGASSAGSLAPAGTQRPTLHGIAWRRARPWLLALCGLAALSACGGGSSGGSSSAAACLSSAALTGTTVQLAMSLSSASLLSIVPAVTTASAPSNGIYTPLEIRQAYQASSLPTLWTGLDPAQAAAFGAGQTIYVLDLYHVPAAAQELNYFSQTFALPPCTATSIPATVSLPLAAASASQGCTFSQVYASSSGSLTTTPPAFNALWWVETTLDIEWAHVIAPLARIILVEVPANGSAPALNLIDTMGPGIVSMSWGTTEDSVGMPIDMFEDAQMSFLAGSGDHGPAIMWPAVMPQVLAVGGTTMASYTASSRDEAAWSTTGGGISQSVTAPPYQLRLGLGMRSEPDVAMMAGTAQYEALIPPAASSPTGGDTCPAAPSNAVSAPATAPSAPAGLCPPVWQPIDGTSIATPEWAGILAVADAQRALLGLGVLGQAQPYLYALLDRPSLYAQVFQDITTGSNGSCSVCSAGVGYDVLTGLGTPNITPLLAYLDTSPVQVAPIVSSLSVSGSASQALSVGVPFTAVQPVRWSLAGAPSGMSIDSSTGVLSWPQPTPGNYSVTATATDPLTLLSGSATLSVRISGSGPPTISTATLSGTPGQPFSYALQLSNPQLDPLAFSLASAPSGMSVDAAGVLSWASPAAGSYSPTVTVTDTSTSQSASAILHLSFSATATGPLWSANTPSATAGTALSAVLATLADSSATSAQIAITGAATGMSFRVSGQSVLMSWPSPQCGSYTLTLTATDSAGLSSQTSVVVSVAA